MRCVFLKSLVSKLKSGRVQGDRMAVEQWTLEKVVDSATRVLNEGMRRGILETLFRCYKGRYEKWFQLEFINELRKRNPDWKIEAEKKKIKKPDVYIRYNDKKLVISLKVIGSGPSDKFSGEIKRCIKELRKRRWDLLLYVAAFNNGQTEPHTMPDFASEVEKCQRDFSDVNIIETKLCGDEERGFGFVVAELRK